MTANGQPDSRQNAGSLDEFPHAVAEAVDWLESVLSDDGLAELAAMAEADLITLHFGLGAYVRNSLDLWQNEALLADADVATEDDASALIIEALWRRLHSKAQPEAPP